MKNQSPITLDAAILLMIKYEDVAYASGRKGAKPGEHIWFQYNFIEWLAEIGHHIELTGDEFEASVMSDQIA